MKIFYFFLFVALILTSACKDNSVNSDNSSNEQLLLSIDSIYVNHFYLNGNYFDSTILSKFRITYSVTTNDVTDSIVSSGFSIRIHDIPYSYGFSFYGFNNNRTVDTTISIGNSKMSIYPKLIAISHNTFDTTIFIYIKNFRFYKIN